MLGSRRSPEAATVRARLQALTPRWVPTDADLAMLAPATRDEAPPLRRTSDDRGSDDHGTDGRGDQVPARGDDPVDQRRHSLPDELRPVWKFDGAAARAVISLTLAAAVGALAVVVWGWPRGDEVEKSRGVPATSSANVLVDATTSAEVSAGAVIVDVDGEVRRPGVVELSTGSRVFDAIKAAGGVTRAGDTGALNLAEVLIDGQQVVVPSRREAAAAFPTDPVSPTDGTTTAAPTGSGSVSLNSATAVELETLPGIGPVLAAAIVEWRTQNGGFTSLEQLEEVSGIGPATFAELAPLIRL